MSGTEGEGSLREEDILGVLNQLTALKDSKPDVYKQLMQSLGMSGDTDPFANGEEGVRKMTESIMKMRGEGKDVGVNSDITLSKEGKQQPKGITITPVAGFAIKTVLMGEKEETSKVFINLTQHAEIAKPGMKKKLNDEGEEVEGMNIPMSVGPLHFEEDNKGASCRAYDIIVNEEVIEETASDVTGKYRDFICQLAIQCVEQKHKLVLDKRYKLPKLKYCGKEVQSQYIQDRKNMPSIVEVSSSSSSSGSGAGAKAAKAKKGKEAAGGVTSSRVVELADADLTYLLSWLCAKDPSAAQSGPLSVDTLDALFEQVPVGPHSVNEYLDPVQSAPRDGAAGLLVRVELSSAQAQQVRVLSGGCVRGGSGAEQMVQVSPFRVSLKLPQHKKSSLYLPHAIVPNAVQAHLAYPSDGFVNRMHLLLLLPLDRSEAASAVDAGSKPWLMSQALSQDETAHSSDSANPYSRAVGDGAIGRASTAGDAPSSSSGELPEDKFHIRLPDDVDQYTGVKMPQNDPSNLIEAMDGKVNYDKLAQYQQQQMLQQQKGGQVAEEEDELLPEDRFHAKDASSSYLINQREQAKKDKWDKYEKEKAERKNDPNVEYVDMDDFRSGGKYAGDRSKEGRDLAALAAASDRAAPAAPSVESEALRKAASIVANNQNLPLDGMLSSTLWSELL